MTGIILGEVEVRVLGCLIEKEMSTPEYYPLSLNALVNACNQKNNREPVVAYDEVSVARALESLKPKQLVYEAGGSRVVKYGHNFTKLHKLINKEAAIMAELMLRGPQTLGELRTHTERMSRFESLDEVEESVKNLETIKFAVKLPRQPGRKESRYAHQLMGEIRVEEMQAEAPAEAAVLKVRAENERLARLEEDVAAMRHELEELKRAFFEFKKQFE